MFNREPERSIREIQNEINRELEEILRKSPANQSRHGLLEKFLHSTPDEKGALFNTIKWVTPEGDITYFYIQDSELLSRNNKNYYEACESILIRIQGQEVAIFELPSDSKVLNYKLVIVNNRPGFFTTEEDNQGKFRLNLVRPRKSGEGLISFPLSVRLDTHGTITVVDWCKVPSFPGLNSDYRLMRAIVHRDPLSIDPTDPMFSFFVFDLRGSDPTVISFSIKDLQDTCYRDAANQPQELREILVVLGFLPSESKNLTDDLPDALKGLISLEELEVSEKRFSSAQAFGWGDLSYTISYPSYDAKGCLSSFSLIARLQTPLEIENDEEDCQKHPTAFRLKFFGEVNRENGDQPCVNFNLIEVIEVPFKYWDFY